MYTTEIKPSAYRADHRFIKVYHDKSGRLVHYGSLPEQYLDQAGSWNKVIIECEDGNTYVTIGDRLKAKFDGWEWDVCLHGEKVVSDVMDRFLWRMIERHG